MSDSTKKQETIIRYLLTGTTDSLHQAAVENPASFSLEEHAAELLARGYEILESDLPQKDFQKNLKKKTYTVYLRERVTIVFPSQPKVEGEPVSGVSGLFWPAGLEDFDLTVTRSRRINYQYDDGRQAFPPVSETIEFERSAMVNHVTGQVTYMPWQVLGEGGFAQVDTPKLVGYGADILSVAAVEVLELESSQDQDIVVTFSKESQFAKIEVTDTSSDALLFSQELEGEAGDVIDYPIAELLDQYIAKGYEVVRNPFDDTHRFGEEGDRYQTLVISLQPRVVLVHENDLPEVGQPVYPNLKDSVVWPTGVRESKLRRLVTRTIVNQHEDGQVIETVKQTVEFRRPAQINLLTQDVSYAEWELVSEQAIFPAYIPEDLAGYSPRPRKLPELTPITAESADLKEIITYARQIQRVGLRFVDRSQEDLVLYQTQLVGKTGEVIRFDFKKKIQEFLNIGYAVIENNFPEDAVFSSELTEKEVYTIVLEPRTVTVSSTEPKRAGRFIDEKANNGPKWPVGVDEQDLRHVITRTIHYRYENGQEVREPHVDAIMFERQATLNLVTSQITYTPWASEMVTFDDHEVPQVDGYYTTRDQIAGIPDITVTSADFEVVVYYIKTSNQINYTITDVTTDEVLETKLVNGRSVQKLREEIDRKLQPYLAKGYKLENAQRLNLALKNPDTTSLTIDLSQQIRKVLPDQPQAVNGLVDGYSQLNWPSGLEANQLTKQVTRQLQLVYDNGEKISGNIHQTVTFKRTASVNLVTGEVSYGEWQTKDAVFPAVELPDIDGYKASLTHLPEEAVEAETLDSLVEVVYHPKPAQVTIIFQDADSKEELGREDLVAAVGEQLAYAVAERLPLLGLAAYEVVKNASPKVLDFKAEEKTYRVTLKPKTVTVTLDNPHQAGTTSLIEGYGLFTWPEGLDKEALVGSIRRSVSYKTDLGERLTKAPVEQYVHLTRSATVNLATKAINYQEWTAGVTSFEAVESPSFEGLVASHDAVPALELTDVADLVNHSIDLVVTYSRQPYQCRFIFTNTLHQEVLGEVELTVLDKKDVLEAYQDLLSTYQQLGYVLTDVADLELEDWDLAEQKVFDIALKPQLMVVSMAHIDDNFASFDEEVANQLQALEGLSRLDLSRQINRTIKYHYTNGKQVARPNKDTVTFTRSARVNLVTGEIFYDDWSSYYPTFDEVLSPVIDDYSPSKEVVEAIELVTADSQDMIETIVYTRNIQQVVVSVVDKATGNIIYAESITGTNGITDTNYNVSKIVKKGHDIVAHESKVLPVMAKELPKEETVSTETANSKQSHPKPKLSEKPAKKPSVLKQALAAAKKPEVKEITIGFKDVKLQKAHGLQVSDLVKTLTRTVRFVDGKEQDLADSLTQTVTYQRQAKVLDDKSGIVNFTAWTAVDALNFAEVKGPKIDGYEPSQAAIESYQPNPDTDQNQTVFLTYQPSKIKSLSIVFIDQESEEELMNFTFANKGDAYAEKKIKKGSSFLAYKGYQVVTTDYPDNGELINEDTLHYRIFVRKNDKGVEVILDENEAKQTSRKLRDSINTKPGIGENKAQQSIQKPAAKVIKIAKDSDEEDEIDTESQNKQKGFFDFLFKD